MREDGAYRKMIRDELKEKFAVTNLKVVDSKVLHALRSSSLLKDDPKQVCFKKACTMCHAKTDGLVPDARTPCRVV